MRYLLTACSILEYGQRRDAAGNPHQEDALFPDDGQQEAAATGARLFLVCDGMGGHDAGEVASATVCQALSDSILGHTTPEGPFTDDDLRQGLADAFSALDARDTGAVKKMGTTLTLLKFHNRGVTIAHIGDSRVYHFRPDGQGDHATLLHVTRDHSLVNSLVLAGEITPEEARHHPQRNVITRAMQPHMDRRPRADIYHADDIRPGDCFMLCTDGMLEQTEDEHLRFIFADGPQGERAPLDRKADMLRRLTRDNHDNHTAILVRVDKVIDRPDSADAPDATAGTLDVTAGAPNATATLTADATAHAVSPAGDSSGQSSAHSAEQATSSVPSTPAVASASSVPAPHQTSPHGDGAMPQRRCAPASRRRRTWRHVIILLVLLLALALLCSRRKAIATWLGRQTTPTEQAQPHPSPTSSRPAR